MANDDPAARPPPRFVPTLTEIIAPGHEAALSSTAPAQLEPLEPSVAPASSNLPALATPSVDQIADAVLARLGPQLERLIPESVARVLHEQMLGFNGRVQKAVAELVREAVARDIAQHGSGADDGKNP